MEAVAASSKSQFWKFNANPDVEEQKDDLLASKMEDEPFYKINEDDKDELVGESEVTGVGSEKMQEYEKTIQL